MMKENLKKAFCWCFICLFLTLPLIVSSAASSDLVKSHHASANGDENILKNKEKWVSLIQENKINRLHFELTEKKKPNTVAFINVNLILMTDDKIRSNQTVVVEQGIIKAIGKTGQIAIPSGALKIEGNGMFLIPRLTDMHIHSDGSNSQRLLNLVNGVTSVRDMNGYRWLLQEKNAIRQNKLLAPNYYLTGQILNSREYGSFFRVVKTVEEARAAVKEQKKEGFDFIKVYTGLSPEIFKAISEEAKLNNLDIVGHVPFEVKLEEALKLGQRTIEHFTGYYSAMDLEITSEDYPALTKNADLWNCPTFYTIRRLGLTRPEVAELLTTEESKYVPAADKKNWLKAAKEERESFNVKIYDNLKKIFQRLQTVEAKFLAGTDCGGGYPNMVPGFALHEELLIFESLGMSPFNVLKTTTINAAEAMRKQNEFGTIEVGKRADFILLSKNPLETVKNLESKKGVMVRGIWLDEKEIAEILAKIETIYQDDEQNLSSNPTAAVRDLFRQVKKLEEVGYTGQVGKKRFYEKLGASLIDAQMFDEAKWALELNSANFSYLPEVHVSLAQYYQLKGKKDEAIKSLTRALEINPSDKKAAELLNALKSKDN